MSRTALIVEASLPETLEALRLRYATDARFGVPPHLTVLHPFVPVERFDRSVLAALSAAIRDVPAFDFALTETGWFGESVLWIGPETPQPFVELTEAVVRAFPDYLPYGGKYDASVPHLTVGDSASPGELVRAERAIGRELPLTGTASAVTVLAESEGRWRRMATLPLAPRAS